MSAAPVEQLRAAHVEQVSSTCRADACSVASGQALHQTWQVQADVLSRYSDVALAVFSSFKGVGTWLGGMLGFEIQNVEKCWRG